MNLTYEAAKKLITPPAGKYFWTFMRTAFPHPTMEYIRNTDEEVYLFLGNEKEAKARLRQIKRKLKYKRIEMQKHETRPLWTFDPWIHGELAMALEEPPPSFMILRGEA